MQEIKWFFNVLENYYTNLRIENAFAASLMFVFTYLNMSFIAAFKNDQAGMPCSVLQGQIEAGT